MATDVSFRLRHNLPTLIKDRAITAAQLSRKTGVAKQVLSDWMSGVQPRKIEHLYAVARELGVSMESLCFAGCDDELLAKGRSGFVGVAQVAADSGGGTRGGSSGGSGGMVISPDEIRGRFEIHLRRIED